MTIYAVNGKEPIAAWIPSLDSAGNGTTTLTDLVGSNDGTLTNMDPATDWVADTDAGGVRALDFDNVDDGVQIPATSALDVVDNFAVSIWAFTRNATGRCLAITHDAAGKRGWTIGFQNQLAYFETSGAIRYNSGTAPIGYAHLVMSVNSSTAFTAWVNGTQVASSTIPAITSYNVSVWIGRRLYTSFHDFLNGRVDDARFFDQSLDASDVSYLYNSGSGRGVTAAAANPAAILQINSQSARVGL